jgi:hypothetical protein
MANSICSVGYELLAFSLSLQTLNIFVTLLFVTSNKVIMKLTCVECKNDVDLSNYPNLAVDQVIECGTCGITLLVTDMSDLENIQAEVVDEGK